MALQGSSGNCNHSISNWRHQHCMALMLLWIGIELLALIALTLVLVTKLGLSGLLLPIRVILQPGTYILSRLRLLQFGSGALLVLVGGNCKHWLQNDPIWTSYCEKTFISCHSIVLLCTNLIPANITNILLYL